MLKTIPNFMRNAADIVALAEKHSNLFVPSTGGNAHASLIPNIYSQFKTLRNEDMSEELKDAIFADADFQSDLRDFHEFIQIQRYDPGDYIAIHRDSYSIRKLHLVTLTSSEIDGLVCEDENHVLVKVFDQAGQYIDFPYDAAHYVSPVKNKRYSIVIGE